MGNNKLFPFPHSSITRFFCCSWWCSSLEMLTGLSPTVLRASHTPNRWNLQLPPAQELSFNRTKQSNGRRRPERGRTGKESAKGQVSVSGGQAKPDLCSPGWSALIPCATFPESWLWPGQLFQTRTCTNPQISRPLFAFCDADVYLPLTEKLGYLNSLILFSHWYLVNHYWAAWAHGATNQDNSGSLIHASSALSCYQPVIWHKKQLLVPAPAEGSECCARDTKAGPTWGATEGKGQQSSFQDWLKALLSCRRVGDGSQADIWHILTAEGCGGGSFCQG